MPAGRLTEYTQETIDKAEKYLLEYKTLHNHSIPSHVGLAKVLNLNISTLYRWASEGKKEIKDILEACKQQQELDLLNNGLDGTFNPQITKLVLGKHGYQEQSKTEHAGSIGLTELSDDELSRKVAALMAQSRTNSA